MNILLNDDKRKELSLMIIGLIVGLCILLMISSLFIIAKEFSLLERNYRWDNWRLISSPDHPWDRTVFQSHISDNPEGQVMFCQGKYQFASVWINGKYVGPYPGSSKIKDNLGLWNAIIPLPPGNVDIVFEVASPAKAYDGKMVNVYLSSEDNIKRYLFSHSLFRVFLAAAGFLIGVFFMLISIAGYVSYSGDISLMVFGLFTIIYMTYTLFHESSPDYLIYELFTPRTVGNISFFLYFSMLIPNFLIFVIKSEYFKKINMALFLMVVAFVTSAFMLHFTGTKLYPDILPYRGYLTIGLSIYYCVTTLIEYKRGNKFAIWLFVWISVTMVAYLMDLVGFFSHIGMPDIRVSYIIIFILMISVFTNSIKSYIQKVIKEKTEARSILLKNQMTMERYKNTMEHMEEIKQIRHEIKNNRAALKIILDQGDIDKAREYLNELGQEDELNKPLLYSENILVDGIISSAVKRMNQCEIKFTYEIELPEELNIPENRLSSFLMNLLNNAIDSCCRKKEQEEKFISLVMKVKKPYLYIKCTNSKGNSLVKQDGQFVTSKEDKCNHGYGLKIMNRIAAQSDGMIEISEEGETVELTAALKVN